MLQDKSKPFKFPSTELHGILDFSSMVLGGGHKPTSVNPLPFNVAYTTIGLLQTKLLLMSAIIHIQSKLTTTGRRGLDQGKRTHRGDTDVFLVWNSSVMEVSTIG